VFSFSDEHGRVSVPQVVETTWFANRSVHGGHPDSAAEVGAAQWSAIRGRKDEISWSRVRLDVVCKLVAKKGRQGYGASTGPDLGRTEQQLSADLRDALLHSERSTFWIDPGCS
jgi:hypothetical protein